MPDNAFRHSLISYRLELRDDIADVARDCGTSAQKIFSNYRKIVDREDAVNWMNLTPEFCRKTYTPLAKKTHAEISTLGGRSRSEKKILAVSKNLANFKASQVVAEPAITPPSENCI
jgi:hypothetical protein